MFLSMYWFTLRNMNIRLTKSLSDHTWWHCGWLLFTGNEDGFTWRIWLFWVWGSAKEFSGPGQVWPLHYQVVLLLLPLDQKVVGWHWLVTVRTWKLISKMYENCLALPGTPIHKKVVLIRRHWYSTHAAMGGGGLPNACKGEGVLALSTYARILALTLLILGCFHGRFM